MYVLPVCIYVHHLCAWCLSVSKEGIGSGAGVAYGGEPACGSWELNSGSPKEQQMCLFTQLSLQPY